MIILDYSDKRPIYEQVVARIKDLIFEGILTVDEQMPSVRSLAIDLSINPNTIQKAYAQLEREGFIYAVKGRGNYVADITAMLPVRIQKFYEELDALLERLSGLSITTEDLINHIREYDSKRQSDENLVTGGTTND